MSIMNWNILWDIGTSCKNATCTKRQVPLEHDNLGEDCEPRTIHLQQRDMTLNKAPASMEYPMVQLDFLLQYLVQRYTLRLGRRASCEPWPAPGSSRWRAPCSRGPSPQREPSACSGCLQEAEVRTWGSSVFCSFLTNISCNHPSWQLIRNNVIHPISC